MSEYDKKILMRSVLLCIVIGALIVFIYLRSKDIEQFFSVIQSICLSFSALFTTFWTYTTFGRKELREEVQLFIDALEEYAQSVNDKHTYGPLYKSLVENPDLKETWEQSLKNQEVRVEKSKVELQRLFDKSTHIPKRIRAKLILYGDFFFTDYVNVDIKKFNENIFYLKSILRNSVHNYF